MSIFFLVISNTGFDLSNPLSLGWQANWSSTTNHIAIVTGALPAFAGPYIISITLEATDPLTDIELPSGVSLTNDVQIFLPSGVNDQNYLNNNDSATVVTPGIDLWVEKTGNVEGGFPGVGPGARQVDPARQNKKPKPDGSPQQQHKARSMLIISLISISIVMG